MGKFIYSVCISLLMALGYIAFGQTQKQVKWITAQYNLPQLLNLQNEFYRLQTADKARVQEFAQQHKIPMSYEHKGAYAELRQISPDGTPLYYTTYNVDAAHSTRTNHLHTGGSLGLNLMGNGMTAYVWDGGHARLTHQEYDGSGGNNRYSIGELIPSYHYHAAHVTGTIIGSGHSANAKGMAPHAKAIGYDWDLDEFEATAVANLGMLVSNHSYGFASLTPEGNYALPSHYAGAYITTSRAWDQIMYNAPYYLMVVAAGNDGNHQITPTPLEGMIGYDKLTGHATSKNNLVVANAMDASVDSNGNLLSVTINGSSSQGPTDDYRIKPDITGNGSGVYSTLDNADNAYGNLTGTSMAAPNVTGSLLLLQEHYKNLNNGNFMRAATLKGLALHTADDAGPTGPDAVYGWGLLNSKKAAETISKHNHGSYIYELNLQNNTPQTITVNSDGINELRASISWTDRPGSASSGTNNSSPRLFYDLDLRVIKNQTTHFPWKLTSVNTNAKMDNNVDPFERIEIPNAYGSYTIQISHKGTLPPGGQNFSLIITGVTGMSCSAAITQIQTGIACGVAAAPITVQGNSNTTSLKLYANSMGGAPLQTIEGNSGTFMTPEITEDTTFYVSASRVNCESPRIAVHTMFAPAPTELSITRTNNPEEPQNCQFDFVLLEASGGIEESIVFYEGFSSGVYMFWGHSGTNADLALYSVTNNYAGGGPPEAALGYATGNTNGSWSSFPYNPYSNEKIAVELSDYTDVKLSFRHMFDAYTESSFNRNIFAEVSTDGINYQTVWSRTNITEDIQKEIIDLDLSAYNNTPNLYLRFRYDGSSMGINYWFLDDVTVTGVKQNPIVWSPFEGLYLDELRTQPYAGEFSNIVYASPDESLTYTASVSSTQNDCVITRSETVQVNSSNFIAQTGNWNEESNWIPPIVPSLEKCVRIPSGNTLTVNYEGASAKNIHIEEGGKLIISSGNTLTVADEISHYGSIDNFLVEHDANFIQLNNEVENIGQIKVQKNFVFTDMENPTNNRKQYNFVSSPLRGQSVKTIYPGNPTALEMNEATNLFIFSNGEYIAGRGFAIREPSKVAVPNSSILAEFKGQPYNGYLNYTIQYTPNVSEIDQGYNLIGNPYPSNLDLTLFYDRNQALIEPNFYFWDNRGNEIFVQQGSNYSGSNYAYFNAVAGGGTGTAAAGAVGELRVPTKNASVGTAFVIKALPEANQTQVTFENAMRSGQNGPNFHGRNNDLDSGVDRYWVNLTTPQNLTNMIAIVYFDGGTNLFSKDDSKTFSSSDDFYSIAENYQLKIQGKAPFANNDTVALGFRAFTHGSHTISLFQQEGVFDGNQDIYLRDKLSNRTTKLNTNHYTFRSEPGEFNDRFEIIYKLRIIRPYSDENEIMVYRQRGDIQVDSSKENLKSIEIFDRNNQLIYQKESLHQKSWKIPAHALSKQVLFIQLTTDKGEVISHKYIHR